jgi:spore coat polysaccharide biosynthesis protein SpsF
MRIVAIVQARMGSTRLPCKVMRDIAGEPMLGRVLQRLKHCRYISQLVVATTKDSSDDCIVDYCNAHSVGVYRGSMEDVLDRYWHASQEFHADVVVRITSDCPLIDPEITDKTIQEFLDVGPDYASNTLVRSYPRGLDTEVVSSRVLFRCWQNANLAYQRSHVTAYIYEHPESFRLHAVKDEGDCSGQRWTVDTAEDLEFVRAVYSNFIGREDFNWIDVLELLGRHPELVDLNRHVLQKTLHEG